MPDTNIPVHRRKREEIDFIFPPCKLDLNSICSLVAGALLQWENTFTDFIELCTHRQVIPFIGLHLVEP